MSRVLFISDLHLGHRNIHRFVGDKRGGGEDTEAHALWLVDQWNSVVTKRDLVWVLGDVAFDMRFMNYLHMMEGTKNLILGNHDKFDLGVYLKYFNKVHGFLGYKCQKGAAWLSHAPIHPDELRGRYNFHGHTHLHCIDDDRYRNVCVEQSYGVPRTMEEILNT
jgi:calcineurin-like phosphoesterase family protein